MSADTFVLVHRLELADNQNQTAEAVPFLFEDEEDAIAFASSLMRDTMAGRGWPKADQDAEAEELVQDLSDVSRMAASANMHSEHRVILAGGGSETFELYRRGIAPKGHLYPEA